MVMRNKFEKTVIVDRINTMADGRINICYRFRIIIAL